MIKVIGFKLRYHSSISKGKQTLYRLVVATDCELERKIVWLLHNHSIVCIAKGVIMKFDWFRVSLLALCWHGWDGTRSKDDSYENNLANDVC